MKVKTVKWSNEFKCIILFGNHGWYILHSTEERVKLTYSQHTVQTPASLMIWGCINASSVGSLHLWSQGMRSHLDNVVFGGVRPCIIHKAKLTLTLRPVQQPVSEVQGPGSEPAWQIPSRSQISFTGRFLNCGRKPTRSHGELVNSTQSGVWTLDLLAVRQHC